MSKDQQLGDAPIEDRYAIQMGAVASVIDEVFNGDLRGSARTTGFVLLVFPFGSKDGRCNYISNGADRRDMVKMLREQADRFESEYKCDICSYVRGKCEHGKCMACEYCPQCVSQASLLAWDIKRNQFEGDQQ